MQITSRAPCVLAFAAGVFVGFWSSSDEGRRLLRAADECDALQRHATIPDTPPGASSFPEHPFAVHKSRPDGGSRLATKLCRSTFTLCPRTTALVDPSRVDEHLVAGGAQPVVLANRSLGLASPVSTVGAVVAAYDRIFEAAKLFSFTSWLGVSMQQDPSDALALADLIWRVRPERIIELGTNAGGGAFFFAHVARQYSATARVLTLDPSDRCCSDAKKARSAWDWDPLASQVCPHCTRAFDSPLWRSGAIEFIHGTPADAEIVDRVHAAVGDASPVLVIEDSSHGPEVVVANLDAYHGFVSRASYFVVQDTKIDRLAKAGPASAIARFLRTEAGAQFEVDRRPEYYLYSQHSGGFLRKRS